MKKCNALKCLFFLFIPVLFCSASCNFAESLPPFILEKPECVLSSDSDAFNFAGVRFSLFNLAAVPVSSFTVSFVVYESEDGENPLASGNVLKATFEGELLPGENKSFEISLDEYLLTVPEEPFYIDYFFVKEITFSDGSVWKDYMGVYSCHSD